MAILNFDKPKKINTTEDHNHMYASEAQAAGTYVPNMSEADQLSWKAKKVGGNDPRIEIRKTVQGFDPTLVGHQWGFPNPKQGSNCHAQMLAIVRPNGAVIMSANARMAFERETWIELVQAIDEAVQILDV